MTKVQSVTVTAYLFAVFGFLCGIAALLIVLVVHATGPELIGRGCSGAGGDIYAYSESDFPVCTEIKAVRG